RGDESRKRHGGLPSAARALRPEHLPGLAITLRRRFAGIARRECSPIHREAILTIRLTKPSMAWVYLFIAGLLEIAWAIGLKYTDGFKKPFASVVTVILMIGSFYVLSLA